jgi:hypothetical protein
MKENVEGHLGEITRRNFLIEGLFLFCEMVQQNIAY